MKTRAIFEEEKGKATGLNVLHQKIIAKNTQKIDLSTALQIQNTKVLYCDLIEFPS